MGVILQITRGGSRKGCGGNGEEHIPDFLKNELVEMYDKLKKEIACPICFTELKSDEIKFSSCGHKFCGECLSKLDNCAICRKKIYRKK